MRLDNVLILTRVSLTCPSTICAWVVWLFGREEVEFVADERVLVMQGLLCLIGRLVGARRGYSYLKDATWILQSMNGFRMQPKAIWNQTP
jgi:DNA modification methylase